MSDKICFFIVQCYSGGSQNTWHCIRGLCPRFLYFSSIFIQRRLMKSLWPLTILFASIQWALLNNYYLSFSFIIVHHINIRVLNFDSIIYWRPQESCSMKSTQFSVYYRSPDQSRNWTRSYCIIKTDKNNGFSCEFLTCAVTKDQGYEVQVKVNGSNGRLENIRYFQPLLESMYMLKLFSLLQHEQFRRFPQAFFVFSGFHLLYHTHK